MQSWAEQVRRVMTPCYLGVMTPVDDTPNQIGLTSSHSLSAVALRNLADQIEATGLSDTRYVPASVALVRDGDEWVALATLTPAGA